MDDLRTPHRTIATVGVLGLGNFGAFAISRLRKDSGLRVIGYDSRDVPAPDGAERVSLAEVVDVDVLVLAVPYEAYDKLLPQIAKHLEPKTLIVDICSVKVYPEKAFAKHLPNHPNLLLTHPLFGPQSAADSTTGHTLIVTKVMGELAEKVIEYCEDRLVLDVQRMSSSDHDKAMGKIHVLTFFVARGLADLKLEPTSFETPSYKMITDLVAFNDKHTDELFRTIQQANPYANQIRRQFIDNLEALEKNLQDDGPH